MPLPKCSPQEVYNKKTKKCIEIGGDVYKNIIKNNPDAFKHYVSKIAKATAPKSECLLPHQVYNKHTGKCVNIGSKSFIAAIVKNTMIFNDQMDKIGKFLKNNPPASVKKLSKTQTAIKKPPNTQTDVSPNETLANIQAAIKKTQKTQAAVKKTQKTQAAVKKTQKTQAAVIKNEPKTPSTKDDLDITSKLLLKRQPVPTLSGKTSFLFMKKVTKYLKTMTPRIRSQFNTSKLPNDILIRKNTIIYLPYINFYSQSIKFVNISKLKIIRSIHMLRIPRNNFYDYFYKHVLKQNVNPAIIDTEWFLNMQKYFRDLTASERWSVYSYSKFGDVYMNLLERGMTINYSNIHLETLMYEILNSVSRKEFKDLLKDYEDRKKFIIQGFPPFSEILKYKTGVVGGKFHEYLRLLNSNSLDEGFLKKMIKNLSDRLHGVIAGSPSTKKTMIVYRGVKDSFFTADNYTSPLKKNEVFVNKGFVSTSLLHTVSLKSFTDLSSKCCFKVITILPGTKCIPLIGLSHFNDEIEILLDRNAKYLIRDKYITKAPLDEMTTYSNTVSLSEIKVSEIIIA